MGLDATGAGAAKMDELAASDVLVGLTVVDPPPVSAAEPVGSKGRRPTAPGEAGLMDGDVEGVPNQDNC